MVVVGASGFDKEREVVETAASASEDSVRIKVRSEATDCTTVVVVLVGTEALSVTETPLALTLPEGPLGNAGCEELTARELTGWESMGWELGPDGWEGAELMGDELTG
jgi:hypothetical protein